VRVQREGVRRTYSAPKHRRVSFFELRGDESKMLRRLLCLAVLAIAGLASTATPAESAMTMRLGTPDLQSGVLIVVPVIVSCSPFDPSLTLFSENASVSVEQDVGRRIAFGSAFITQFLPQPLLFQCDDTEHNFVMNVLANTGGPPFKRGLAVFSAFASASAGVSCGPGCFFTTASQQGSFGPTPIRIR
jgi:hypothetical protein